MLNLSLIRSRMAVLGLSQSALAQQCDVSRETASCWLSGVTHPRPSAMRRLAAALDVDVTELLLPSSARPEILWIAAQSVATEGPERYRYDNIGEDMGGQLSTLAALIPQSLFSKSQLTNPTCTPEYLQQVLEALGVESGIPASSLDNGLRMLIDLHRRFGSVLVPVKWSRPGWAYSGAVIALPDSNHFFVYVNVHNGPRGIARTLAEALGACYSWSVSEQVRAAFSQAFADRVVAPLAMRGSEVSVVAENGYEPQDFIRLTQRMFDTPVFQAISDHQVHENGRDPAFVSTLLGIPLSEARELSIALYPG